MKNAKLIYILPSITIHVLSDACMPSTSGCRSFNAVAMRAIAGTANCSKLASVPKWHLVPRPVHHKTRNSSQGTGLMCSPIASKTCSTWQPFRACADKYSMMTSSQIKHQGMSKGGTHRRSKKTLGCCGCRRKLV